jgi:transcriptional regulator with XRE-family HTH domain
LLNSNKKEGENMEIIDKISELLIKKNKTQKELTDYLGLDKSTYSAWKNGKSRSYNKYLKEIATFLCVSVSDLIGDDSNLNNEVNNIYFSFAKKAQDNGIDPNDIEMAIAMILKLKDKGNKEE